MFGRIAKNVAATRRHISPNSLRDAGVPLRDAQTVGRNADPRTAERYNRARGNLDPNAVHGLTVYVPGV